MADEDRKTDPTDLRPHVCEHCAALVAAFDSMREEFVRLAREARETRELVVKPPWLDAVLNASLGTSAALEVRDEVVALTERVDAIEMRCESRHDPDPLPSIIPSGR